MENKVADRASQARWRPLVAPFVVLACVAVFGAYQAFLTMEAGLSNACQLTPPGYFNQTLVKKERHLLWYDCVLDPGNGEPRYTIHRPWQNVRNADGSDPTPPT